MLAVLFTIAASASTDPASAQEETSLPPPRAAPTPPSETDTALPAAVERKPELHYLLDEHGKLVPVPSFRWEDFAKLLALEETDHPTEELPAWVIERLEISGIAQSDHAEVELRLSVSVRDRQWHSVPLGLDHCLLLEHTATQGEARLAPRTGGGLTAWIKGNGDQAVQLRLKLWKRLENTSTGRRISLAVPKAVTATAELQVPEKNAVAELPEDEGIVESSALENGTTLRARLVADTVHLAWRAPPTEEGRSSGWLEATGELDVRVDRDGVVTNAHLRLRSTGAPIESFQVTLPASAELLPAEFSAYAVEPIASEGSEDAEAQQRVQVRLFEPNTVADVRLQCRQDWTSPETALDVGGFAVEEAVRQRGHVAFQLADDLRAEWEERFLVRRVEDLPSALRNEQVQAGFEYSGQPFSLVMRIAPRVTRLSVEPQYVVQVSEKELLLTARLRCRVRGGKLRQLKVDPAAWQLDDAGWGSDGLVATDEVELDSVAPMTIPFNRSVEGEFELRFQARQPIASDAKQIVFSVPRPLGTVIAPAQIVVVASDPVKLTPHAEAEMNLAAQRPDATVTLPTSQQPPRFYRGEVSQARFAAAFEVRPAALEAEVRTQIDVVEKHFDVRQVVTFRAQNAAVDRVAFRVPRELAALNAKRLTLLGATPTVLSIAALERTNSEILEAPLPTTQFEDFEVELRYTMPWDGRTERVDLPLLQPANATAASSTLRVVATAPLTVNVTSEGWRHDGGPASDDMWSASLPQDRVTLALAQDASPARAVFIERAWIRTFLVNDIRQERVTWLITAPDGDVTLRLPDGVLSREVTARFDGRAAQMTFDSDGLLTVIWPAEADRGVPHLLEFDFHLEGLAGGPSSTLAPVALASPGWVERTHWELLLPEQTHLLDVSSNYAREYAWRWYGAYWGRESDAKVEEIRSAKGADENSPYASRQNRYVMSSVGMPGTLAVTSVSRSALVLAASATALAMGLAFLFFPAMRRAEAALVVAVAIILTVAWWDDAAILFLQSAVPGFVAVIVALIVRGLTSRRRPGATLHGSTHVAPRRGLSDRSGGGSSVKTPSTSSRVPIHTASSELS